ncbi:unnamed protein product [Rangifer tarandus platyrhynchus]|uniref:Uncharacterized protein n=1 Tax=Rangifer tarandus platyrhynchus TaxID=3082113 RepID=A0AC59Y9Z9_RANTA
MASRSFSDKQTERCPLGCEFWEEESSECWARPWHIGWDAWGGGERPVCSSTYMAALMEQVQEHTALDLTDPSSATSPAAGKDGEGKGRVAGSGRWEPEQLAGAPGAVRIRGCQALASTPPRTYRAPRSPLLTLFSARLRRDKSRGGGRRGEKGAGRGKGERKFSEMMISAGRAEEKNMAKKSGRRRLSGRAGARRTPGSRRAPYPIGLSEGGGGGWFPTSTASCEPARFGGSKRGPERPTRPTRPGPPPARGAGCSGASVAGPACLSRRVSPKAGASCLRGTHAGVEDSRRGEDFFSPPGSRRVARSPQAAGSGGNRKEPPVRKAPPGRDEPKDVGNRSLSPSICAQDLLRGGWPGLACWTSPPWRLPRSRAPPARCPLCPALACVRLCGQVLQ